MRSQRDLEDGPASAGASVAPVRATAGRGSVELAVDVDQCAQRKATVGVTVESTLEPVNNFLLPGGCYRVYGSTSYPVGTVITAFCGR